MPEYVPVSFSALPLVSSVSPSDQTLVVQAGVAKRAPFSVLPTAPAGPPGPQGPPGTQIITGNSPPTTGLGQSGDIYIQINTGDVYRKTGNTWNLIGNIKGPPGEPGQQGPVGQPGRNPEILFGVGDPDNAIGNNGDLYINTNTGELFSKVNNNWVFRVFLKGERGTRIYSGDTPPPQTIGLNGDYYINTSNGNLFKKEEGNWTLIYNLGSGGVSNSGGIAFYFVENINSLPQGNYGDVAIIYGNNENSGLVYQKESNNWVSLGTSKVMTVYNKLLNWSLTTSENQRWKLEFPRHEIFELNPSRSDFYIRFSNQLRFYTEMLGWGQQLHIRIGRQPDSHFVLHYRTLGGTATLSSQDNPDYFALDFNINLGFGERIIVYNTNPSYYPQLHYFIETFRPSIDNPENFNSMYSWVDYDDDDYNDDEEE